MRQHTNTSACSTSSIPGLDTKVLDSGGSGSFATVMAGMEWTVDNHYKFNIRAASMSLGGPGAMNGHRQKKTALTDMLMR